MVKVRKPKVDYITKQAFEPFQKVEPTILLFSIFSCHIRKQTKRKRKENEEKGKKKKKVIGYPSPQSPHALLKDEEKRKTKGKKREKETFL